VERWGRAAHTGHGRPRRPPPCLRLHHDAGERRPVRRGRGQLELVCRGAAVAVHTGMTIAELFHDVRGAVIPDGAHSLAASAVCADSRALQPGALFVAVPGEEEDGRTHADAAVAAGAIAVVSETALDVPVPVVLVPDARTALAELAAAWHGHPADAISLVGITGTLGKTSVLLMLVEILRAAGIGVGSIGSLGISYGGSTDVTPNTTPGPLDVQAALAGTAATGGSVLAMEVTSHALVQGRVHGLLYDLGVFTNLAMLEHLEYHGSFRDYVAAKLRFFDHLKPEAPVIYPAGDRAVRAAVRRHTGPCIAVGGRAAAVHVRRQKMSIRGTRVLLQIRRPLPRPGRPPLPPMTLPLELKALGRTNVANASLAAVAALSVGADPDIVSSALCGMEVPPRRLQIVRAAGPAVIDDTVGHPDSITGVFEVVRRLPHERLHVVFCIRGQRGAVINEHDAVALAIWSRQLDIHSLITTSAADTADERNRVTAEEESAFLRVVADAGLNHRHCDTLAGAVGLAARDAGVRDVVLLLGAQGMDAGAGMLLDALTRR
jgi:UDP-N-acetylmuramoyl-L-alanyl-D-glutamate--2,6-diaminopimelate ligase